MNPQARGSFAPGLFRICGSFFCLGMPQKTFPESVSIPVGAFGWYALSSSLALGISATQPIALAGDL